MSLTNTQYDIILRDYENRQLRNRHELERKTAYVYEHVPGYRELEERVAANPASQGTKYLPGDE
ncbi:MAG: DNA replication protein DnaC, partial [Lachnospiraceae bacterium]|nr:DNA replication protein DnaC [Lachnospiraceae bacterium]